jgi:hypothetical protein
LSSTNRPRPPTSSSYRSMPGPPGHLKRQTLCKGAFRSVLPFLRLLRMRRKVSSSAGDSPTRVRGQAVGPAHAWCEGCRAISGVDGTEGEGKVLPPWCDEHKVGSIVVVATKNHSRRLRRVLNRAAQGHSTSVMVHSARYSSFDPITGGKPASASVHKLSNCRSYSSTRCCTQCRFESINALVPAAAGVAEPAMGW